VSPMERGRARDAEHRIGLCRTERAFGACDWGTKKYPTRLKYLLGAVLGNAAGDAVSA
jgi:hypothetical protein